MVLFLKFLVALLLVFTPFSFAATEPWAFSIIQGISLLIWFLLLITRREILYPSLCKPVFYVFFVIVGLSLVQSCFSQTLLDPVPFYPITLMRLYTLEHASVFVTYLGVILLTIQLFPSLQEVKQLLWMLIVSAIGVALCALCFPNGEYVAKLTGMTRYKEAIGPFINRNHAGMFFTLNSLVALGLFFTYQLRYKFVLAREQKNTFVLQQVSLAVLTICLMIGAVFTRSRGAMLSLLVGLFTYAVLCFWSIPSQLKKRLKGFFYTFVLLILSVGCIYTYVDDINEFAHRSTGTSAEIRQMMYRSANRVLRKYPIWGIGVGSMPVVISSYTEWDVHKYIERLHNDWLEMTLGMGYAGAGLVFIGLLWFMWKVLRRLKRLETRKQFLFAALLSSLVAMGVGSLVDFHFFIPGCALVFFVILGVVLAPTFHKHHVHEIRLSAPLRLLVCTVLIGAAFIPLQKTRCWRQFFIGNGLKTEAKLKAYEQGLSYYPGAHYAARLANAYYNASLQSKDEAEKLHYLELAWQITQHYLEQYPKDKELSKVYIRAWRQLR